MHALFSTCDLCDAHREALEAGTLRVLPPVFRSFGKLKRFRGQVTTLQCLEDNKLVRSTLEGAGLQRVLVIDGAASLRRALLGGNLANLAVQNGWAGVVVNGCVRDVAELAAAPVGVLALGHVPAPPNKHGAGQTDVELEIQGVTVRPGDWLYADEDGALISPHALGVAL